MRRNGGGSQYQPVMTHPMNPGSMSLQDLIMMTEQVAQSLSSSQKNLKAMPKKMREITT
jgi:hypothetical protein